MTSLDEYSLNGKQITPSLIKHDIPEDLHKRAYEIAFNSLKKYTAERDIAEYVKKIFDQEFLPSWQCIVGIE